MMSKVIGHSWHSTKTLAVKGMTNLGTFWWDMWGQLGVTLSVALSILVHALTPCT